MTRCFITNSGNGGGVGNTMGMYSMGSGGGGGVGGIQDDEMAHWNNMSTDLVERRGIFL